MPTPASSDDSFPVQAKEMRSAVEVALDRCSQFDDDCPSRLREAMRYSLLAPGKRLRPMLVLMAAEACGCHWQRALPAACAVEMVHTYSLIHDDLPAMDDDDMRRGRPSCHAQFDEATAILAGDALLARAFEVLARELSPTVAARCCAELGRAAGPSALVGGQADDLAAENDPENAPKTVEFLERIHRRKTGALFTASLLLGGIVAEVEGEREATLREYGQAIGLAFQITDDLLDLDSEPDDGQRLTYPSLLGVEASRRKAAELVNKACQLAAETFGERAGSLVALARYVLARTH